jgi:hypothetical protein
LSDTSIPVLVTTAFALLNASWAVQGAAPRQRLFGFFKSVQTIKPQAFRDRGPVKDAD